MLGGGPSIQLVRLFGIRIGASPSWFVVLFIFIYLLSGYFQDVLGGSSTKAFAVAVAAALLFFLSLVLHEMGHALAARRQKIGVVGIDLWLLGGLAKMSRDTRTPAEEFKVSAAGPAVTLLIVALCYGAAQIVSAAGEVVDVATFDGRTPSPALALLGFLAGINAYLLLFNLVPAFPLDGGRLARAALWRLTGDRLRATRYAGWAGQAFSYLLFAYAAYLAFALDDVGNGIYIAILGFFINQAARSAVVSTEFSERLEGITVADIMDSEPVTMPDTVTAEGALDTFYARYGWDWFAVVDQDGRFRGVLTRDRVEAELAAGRPALAVGELLEAREAEDWQIADDEPIDSLLGDQHLRDRGALMAVDGDGVLRGVITVDQVRRALTAALPTRAAG